MMTPSENLNSLAAIDRFREDKIQALIVLGELQDPIETPNNNFYHFYPETVTQAQTYFRRFALDLTRAFDSLADDGLIIVEGGRPWLTQLGLETALTIRQGRPPIWYWYRDYYSAAESSATLARFCEGVYGRNMSQHGFSDMAEIHWMLEIVGLEKNMRVLDIGCGNGRMAETLSDKTDAFVDGVDYVPEAIADALARTADKRDRLNFSVQHIDELSKKAKPYDMILSIDSIFFGKDMAVTLGTLASLCRPGGVMAIFCGDDLSAALVESQLAWTVYDRSKEHHKHLVTKRRVARPLQAAFEAEGNRFIWENIMAESLAETAQFDPSHCARPRFFYHVKINSKDRQE